MRGGLYAGLCHAFLVVTYFSSDLTVDMFSVRVLPSLKRQLLKKLYHIQISASGIIGVRIIKSSDVSSILSCMELSCFSPSNMPGSISKLALYNSYV